MYKILLVDDEEMVIKSLKATLSWEENGFEIIDYALSAQEAFEKVEKLKPDVIITDIKMPKINGLELIQMIKNIAPDIHCLIISGYAEFAYIQKSIRLEVTGYCLKPFDEDEIVVYLKRIKNNLDKRKKEEGHFDCMTDYIQSNTTEAISYMDSIYKKYAIDFERMKICALYVMGLERIDFIKSMFQVNCGYQKAICLIRYEDIDNISEEAERQSKDSIHMGVSKPIPSADKVANAVREAKCCAFQFFCQEDQAVLTNASGFGKDISLLQGLERELGKMDKRKIRKLILEISDKFINGEYNIDFAIRLQNIYASWVNNFIKTKNVDLVFEYEVLCAIYANVNDLLLQIEIDSNDENSDSNIQSKISNRTFAMIFHYIENNYTKPINVAQLSEEFHINACYISQLFKKEMGITFTDYITKKRIEYAGKLLLETDLKVNEIAEMAGFSDYFYFSRVFRKINKCTPTEYRIL